jgi:hypothetical protein
MRQKCLSLCEQISKPDAMKKIMFLILALYTVNTEAQITLESSQYQGQLRYIHLEYSGFKYAVTNSMNQPTQMNLYNLNHTLYSAITLGAVPANAYSWHVQYVTETLWDTDSTDIDYAIVGSLNGANYFTRVYHENGNLIFSNDSCTFWYGMGGDFGNPVSTPIFNSDSGAKMILWYWPDNFNIKSLVYCLPGKLECMKCYDNTNSCESILDAPNMLKEKNNLNAFPNPSSNTTTIPYNLPEGEKRGEIIFYTTDGKEVAKFKVDNTFNQIIISNTDLSSGTYYYQLKTEKNVSEGKKLVIIK